MPSKKIPKCLINAFRYSAVYICTVIGAGFATGRELTAYFVRFGLWGIITAFCCCIFFAYFLYRLLTALPRRDSRLLSSAVFVFNIIIYASMLAAASEIISFGRFMTALLAAAAVAGGLSCISAVSSVLMPVMLIFMLVIGIYFGGGNMRLDFGGLCNAVPSAVAYAAYNIITPAAVFDDVHTGKKTAAAAAIITGICISASVFALLTPLYINYADIGQSAMPLYALTAGTPFGMVYIALIISAIFTTAVCACKSVVRTAEKYIGGRAVPVFLCTAAALLLSFAGFKDIVDKIYFVFGFVGVIIIANKI